MEKTLRERLHESGEELRAQHSEDAIESTIETVEESNAAKSGVSAEILRSMAGE